MINKRYRYQVAHEVDTQHVWMDFMLVLMKLNLVSYYNVENEYNVKLVSGIESSNILINDERFDSKW